MKNNEVTATPPADVEEAAAVAVIAATAGDPVDPDNDFYAELLELQQKGAKERVFADARDLLETEHLEQVGTWRPVPFFAGAEIKVAHQTVAAEKREQLEAKFREKYSIPENQPLTAKQREVIWRESYYGTVVPEWRNFPPLDGKPMEFTAANFRLMMTSRRFRQFLIQEALRAESWRADRDGALRGNS